MAASTLPHFCGDSALRFFRRIDLADWPGQVAPAELPRPLRLRGLAHYGCFHGYFYYVCDRDRKFFNTTPILSVSARCALHSASVPSLCVCFSSSSSFSTTASSFDFAIGAAPEKSVASIAAGCEFAASVCYPLMKRFIVKFLIDLAVRFRCMNVSLTNVQGNRLDPNAIR